MAKGKVVLGMSGGVDSSVAAYLLKEQGYEVIGVTMEVYHPLLEKEKHLIEDAKRVAADLHIPYDVINFQDIFRKKVIDKFIDEYLHARTPNPCILCNRFVKWEALLHYSFAIGADFIATGHYAKVVKLEEDPYRGRYTVKKSITKEKDQTYVLYNLTQEQLCHTLMPMGDYTKEEVRNIAKRKGLPVAEKPDSQEICFVLDKDYAGFIEKEIGYHVPEGNFIDNNGTILGKHKGLIHYTIGQRKGLQLSLGKPVYVSKLLPETNEVVVGEETEVFTKVIFCNNLNHMAVSQFPTDHLVMAKIRYGNREMPCHIEYMEEDKCLCTFEHSVRAAAPGQAIVFYQGDIVLGGGTILAESND